jgi:crotonobetaine/carnitine-CoA ligase
MGGTEVAVDRRRSDDIVWARLLDRNRSDRPDDTAAIFPFHGDLTLTWKELDRRSREVAAALRGLGIDKGDFVTLFMENSPAMIETFLGAARIGAIVSPVNTSFRGALLQHFLSLSGSKLAICSEPLLEPLLQIESSITVVLVEGAHHLTSPSGTSVRSYEEATSAVSIQALDNVTVEFWDPYSLICTSGTTGVSKGVLSPYGQIHAATSYNMIPRAGPQDVFLIDAPLFHVGGMLSFHTCLAVGALMVVCPRIHRNGYWDRVREYGITHATPMIMSWLLAEPERPDDASNPLERILISTWTAGAEEFCRRFGVGDAYGMFNMTEASSMLLLTKKVGSIGRPRPGVQVRLVDEHDIEVASGQVGELIVRCDLPWEMNLGYHRMPEETLLAWRNGWFHTGDLLRTDADGDFFFVDRKKDSIRLRGENISAYEVEAAITAWGMADQCAVFAVTDPDDAREESVMAAIVRRGNAPFDPIALSQHLDAVLPYYMVPRFIEEMEALPRTTDQEGYGKVRKTELRARGVSSRTWDRYLHLGRPRRDSR